MSQFLELLEDRRLMSASTGAVAEAIVTPIDVVAAAPASVGKGTPVHAEATDDFTAVLGVLPANTVNHVARLHGSINWGDGKSPTAATFVRSVDGSIKVIGSHAYYEAEQFKISVNIWKTLDTTPGHATPALAVEVGVLKTVATVRADNDGGRSLIATATRSFTADLGSFDFKSIDLLFSARVDWGDGSPVTDGVIKPTGHYGTGEFDVVGTHTYAKTGTYKVHVSVFAHLIGSPAPAGALTSFFSTIKVMGNA